MRKMLNTLYVVSEDSYISLNGEVVEVNFSDGSKQGIPIHTLESIVSFSYKGASPALLGKCEEKGVNICFISPHGKYQASIGASVNGNILLRREQFRISDNPGKALFVSKSFIAGKLYNSKHQLLRTVRDHPFQVDCDRINMVADRIDGYLKNVFSVDNKESLMGVEGTAASEYFSVFDDLILQRKTVFNFKERSRRPPLDRVNAMLSFAYVLLANDCASALLSVGLDPYAGFLHTDRPGRKSMALDIMEELRSVYADRFVLNLINNRIADEKDFFVQDTGAVLLSDDFRKTFLTKWQNKKKEEIVHPFLKEKISWGLVPYVQAMLLARHIRGDIDQYPPFFWR